MDEFQIQESKLELRTSFFDECTFIRKSDVIGDEKGISYNINFVREISLIGDNLYRVSLRCNALEEKQGAIEIHIRIVGVFHVQVSDDTAKKTLLNKNAVAILFPFVRSQMTLLTAQIGCPVVHIPIVNIAEMFPDTELPHKEEN